MKSVSKLIAVSVILAVLVAPFTILADGLPSPVEKKVLPGVTVINYAGQSLRFDTPVALVVKLEPVSTTTFRLRFHAWGSLTGQQSSSQNLEVYWEQFGSDVYVGPAPPEDAPWDGVLDSESGFTEK